MDSKSRDLLDALHAADFLRCNPCLRAHRSGSIRATGALEELYKGSGARPQGSGLVVDHVEVASYAMPAEAERGQPSRLELNADGMNRQERDAQPGHNGLLDRVGVAEFHGEPDPGAGKLERSLRHLPSGRPFLSNQKSLSGEQLDPDLPASRPRMPRGHDEHQFIGYARRQTLFTRPDSVPAYHAEIELVSVDLLLDGRRVGYSHAKRDPWIELLEPGREAREYVDPRRGAGSNEQRTLLQPLELGDVLSRARKRREDALGVVLEDSPGLGERDPPAQPVEETSAQLSLELGYVLREGRLAEVQRLCGRPEAAGARHREEYLKLPEGDLHNLTLSEA
jgi:hypothetical protein